MSVKSFPLEKIFGSRTRVKVIALFTTGIKRPYFVREIARTVNERLNAVRRELEILRKIGMLNTHDENRKKYYTLNPEFILIDELTSIMQKTGPGVEDVLFKHVDAIGDISYLCLSGYFTGATASPTDMFIVGNVSDKRLAQFAAQVEKQVNREISYTPMTLNEYRYRRNFNDMFLRQIFSGPYKELVNKLPQDLHPSTPAREPSATLIQDEGHQSSKVTPS